LNVTLFSSNQPRHLALAETLAEISEKVYYVEECQTFFPGRFEDDLFRVSPVMQDYMYKVLCAEREVFGVPRFLGGRVEHLALKVNELSNLDMDVLAPALQSDVYIVFGASYIKGPLADFLVRHRAINIHMGVSPYYRGSSCNFWAMYDNRPELVGATIHLLSKGLDSGAILFHALPAAVASDPFLLGMNAVKSAHNAVVNYLKGSQIGTMAPVTQDKRLEIRYTRHFDFTDGVAAEYLARLLSPEEVAVSLRERNQDMFIRPYIDHH